MSAQEDMYPVVLTQDCYRGAYSGGSWLALAEADELVDGIDTPAQFCLCGVGGPHDDDISAATFWRAPPDWIAVGETPQEALDALRNKITISTGRAYQTVMPAVTAFGDLVE